MQADVLIVTVTETESQVVLRVFRDATGQEPKPEPIGSKIYHDLGIVNDARVFLVLSEMGAGGLGGAMQTIDKGITALSPSAIIMVGIAFGADAQKQSIGDILVSQRLLLYELQRIGTDKQGKLTIISRGDRPHASPWLLDRFKSAHLYWRPPKPKVRFGLILSGEKLVDNIDFRQQLHELEPEALGGEMEGAGLYVACQDRKVDWILVKAICDWADGRKDRNRAKRQALAAENAASFLLFVLQQAPMKAAVGSAGERNVGVAEAHTNVQKLPDDAVALTYLKQTIANRDPEAANQQLKKILLTYAGSEAFRRGYVETIEEANRIPCEVLKKLETIFAEAGEQLGSVYLFKTYAKYTGEAWGGFGARLWLGRTLGYRLDECGINSHKSR